MTPFVNQLASFSHLPKLLCVFGLMLIVNLSVFGSDRVQFKTWNTENGLPQNTVNNIVQTPDGYLWLGTFDGLARFDGTRFKVFKKSNTPALPMNRIMSLFVDSSGRLWIWTADPNTLVLYEDGKFRTFIKGIDFEADYLYHTSIEQGALGFRSGNELYVFTQTKFERRPAEPVKLARVSYDDKSKLVWVNTNDGYFAVSETQSKFYKKDPPLPRDQRQLTALDAVEANGALWFLVPFRMGQRLCVFRNGHLRPSSVSTENLKFFYRDGAGNLWIADFYDGIKKVAVATLNPNDLSKLAVTHFSKANGLASNNVATMLADRDGNIWIGTDKGLQLLLDEPLVTLYSKASGLPSENVYSIVQDKAGAIWFGAWDNYLVKYSHNAFTSELQKWVQALFVDRDARLWAGVSEDVHYRASDAAPWKSVYEELGTPPAERIMITVISQDHDGNMWFGGAGGIQRYQPGRIKTFRIGDGLPGSEVTAFMQTSSGTIWVGTTTGVAQLSGERFTPISSQSGVLKTFVRSLYEDKDGTVWIGTYDSGLFRYRSGRLANINSSSGLFSDGAFCILEDDRGWFWMSSNQGIYRVQRDELNKFADGQIPSVNSVAYGPDEGLLIVEGNGGKQPAGLKASDGRLWFAMAGGVAVIDPHKATHNSGPLPILIEDIKVDQLEIEPQNAVIRVEPGQSTVDIAYTALSFVAPDRVRFRYRLEGLDSTWTDAGSRRVAFFSRLPYGEYTFRVIAANADGVWNTSGATIKVVVLAPFYRRVWFYVLIVLGFVSFIAAMYVYRMRQLQAINAARADFTRRLIESQENERRRIALEMHDSVGQSLSIIRNRALMSLSKPDEHQRLLDQMREISEASASALKETRDIAYNLHPGQIEHLGLSTALATLVESVQGGTSIQFETRIEQLHSSISRDEAINIYRIAQESLSNLIKHSEASQATVALYETNGRLYFGVEDNGRGIPDDKSSGGLGLKGIRERAQIINGELKIESSSGKGTKVTVSLPRVV